MVVGRPGSGSPAGTVIVTDGTITVTASVTVRLRSRRPSLRFKVTVTVTWPPKPL
jgi:hypothetical protein